MFNYIDGTIRQLRQLDQQPVPETYPMFSMVYVKRVTGASPATSLRNLFSRRNSVAPRWSADPPRFVVMGIKPEDHTEP
jgi:hypothetical protein